MLISVVAAIVKMWPRWVFGGADDARTSAPKRGGSDVKGGLGGGTGGGGGGPGGTGGGGGGTGGAHTSAGTAAGRSAKGASSATGTALPAAASNAAAASEANATAAAVNLQQWRPLNRKATVGAAAAAEATVGVEGKRPALTSNAHTAGVESDMVVEEVGRDGHRRMVLRHHVRPSDTLQGLAIQYGIAVEDLRRSNKLWASDSIHVRKVLIVPVELCRDRPSGGGPWSSARPIRASDGGGRTEYLVCRELPARLWPPTELVVLTWCSFAFRRRTPSRSCRTT